jgi:hypothetical protein
MSLNKIIITSKNCTEIKFNCMTFQYSNIKTISPHQYRNFEPQISSTQEFIKLVG